MSPSALSRVRDLLGKKVELPSLPVVYDRLVTVLDHPRSGSADIARVISGDPSLTARLLKVVNSALFSFASKIENGSTSPIVSCCDTGL